MSLRESPAQIEARAERDAFFNRTSFSGPARPRQSRIRESARQRESREARARFFEPKSFKRSAVYKDREQPANNQPGEAKFGPVIGGKTKNEGIGGTLIVKDCDGNEVLRIPKLMGLEGEHEIMTGCEGSSSSYPA